MRPGTAALQALRAYQRPVHPRQRVRNDWDQRALPCAGVAEHFSQPAVPEGAWAKSRGRCPSGDFVSGHGGLGNTRLKM